MRTATPTAPGGRRPARSPRRRRRALVVAACGVLFALLGVGEAGQAAAHPLSTTAVLLDVGSGSVTGELQLPVDRLALALSDPTLTSQAAIVPAELADLRSYVSRHTAAVGADGEAWSSEISGGVIESIDGVDHLVLQLTLTPSTGRTADFTFSYDAVVEHLLSHQILVSARTEGAADYTTVGLITWQNHELPIDGFAPGSTAGSGATGVGAGFSTAVHLGIEHISGGADHLLFLLTLLLPAPLAAARGRWVRRTGLTRSCVRVVHVVSAFAVGHSITLALAALGYVHINSPLVESLIALSILASAVHAIKPLVPGGETVIAAGFGLVHGLAFAAVIQDLGLARSALVVQLLGFNLGIEVTQLMVVALIIPSLLVLSRTRLYPGVRVAGAGIAAVLAALWLAERTGLLTDNPLDTLAEAAVGHGLLLAAGLAVVAVAAFSVRNWRAVDAAPIATARRTRAVVGAR